jgi:hypothetical protein
MPVEIFVSHYEMHLFVGKVEDVHLKIAEGIGA